MPPTPTPPVSPFPDATPAGLIPTKRQQSWGAFIAIVVIVLMIVVGAFYAWGQRIAENQAYPSGSATTEPITP